MAIEWDETVDAKRRVRMLVDGRGSPSAPAAAVWAPGFRDATIDDLRRACEAVGLVVETREEAARRDAHRLEHENLEADIRAAIPYCGRSEDLVAAVRDVVQQRDALKDDRLACLDALAEHVSPDATADTPRMVRPSSVLAGIRSLQGRLRDARSDLREHDAALEAAVERRSEEADASTELARAILNAVPGEDIVSAARRTMASLARSVEKGEALRYDLSTIVDEAFGMQPVMTHEELLSFLESGLRERTRDLAAARARAEKAESRISKAEATSGVSLESVASAYAFACKKLGINPDSDLRAALTEARTVLSLCTRECLGCAPSLRICVQKAIARIDEVLSPGAHVGAAKKGGG